jgi:hypothetical protein
LSWQQVFEEITQFDEKLKSAKDAPRFRTTQSLGLSLQMGIAAHANGQQRFERAHRRAE